MNECKCSFLFPPCLLYPDSNDLFAVYASPRYASNPFPEFKASGIWIETQTPKNYGIICLLGIRRDLVFLCFSYVSTADLWFFGSAYSDFRCQKNQHHQQDGLKKTKSHASLPRKRKDFIRIWVYRAFL